MFTDVKRFIDGCLIYDLFILLSSVFPEARPLCPPVQVDPSRYPEVGALYQHQAEAHWIRLTTLIWVTVVEVRCSIYENSTSAWQICFKQCRVTRLRRFHLCMAYGHLVFQRAILPLPVERRIQVRVTRHKCRCRHVTLCRCLRIHPLSLLVLAIAHRRSLRQLLGLWPPKGKVLLF